MIKKEKKSKKSSIFKYVVTIVVILFVALFSWYLLQTDTTKTVDSTSTKNAGLGQGEVTFLNQDGKEVLRILVEIAEDDYSRAYGLMFRDDLPENQGMLFVFEKEENQFFWMKNTPISLDMIFVNLNNEVVNIEKYTKPYSMQSYPSRKPAKYVIEVVAGYSDQHNIKSGDKIRLNRF